MESAIAAKADANHCQRSRRASGEPHCLGGAARAASLRLRFAGQRKLLRCSKFVLAPPLRWKPSAYAAAPCSRNQAVTSPARQRVQRAPSLIGCGNLAAAIFRRMVVSPNPVSCSTTLIRRSASGTSAACRACGLVSRSLRAGRGGLVSSNDSLRRASISAFNVLLSSWADASSRLFNVWDKLILN